jgi:hypothetical protein
MNSKLGVYDKEKRWKSVDDTLTNLITYENLEAQLSGITSEKAVNIAGDNADPIINSSLLTIIEERAELLRDKINNLRINGYEDKFLSLNADCVDIKKELDLMKLNERLREKRRDIIVLVNNLEKSLHEKAFENLEILFALVNKQNRENGEDLQLDIKEIIKFIREKKSSTIREIDNYRFQLKDMLIK